MRRGRRRRPSPGIRCRLVQVAWLVPEDEVPTVTVLAVSAGFSVSVSPTVQVVDPSEVGRGAPIGAATGGL